MEKEYTLEEIRQYCSNYIQNHYGKSMDNTSWWDKWQLYSFYKEIKQKEIKNEQVCNFGQNEQETKT